MLLNVARARMGQCLAAGCGLSPDRNSGSALRRESEKRPDRRRHAMLHVVVFCLTSFEILRLAIECVVLYFTRLLY